MYNTIYFANFKDIDNNQIRVDIEKENAVSTPTELLLAENPVTIEYHSEGIFAPIKSSGIEINVLTNNVLSDIYTSKVDEVRIRVYKNNSLFWMGYVTPNIYSSEYNSQYDLLTIEGIDTLAQLENSKFTRNELTSIESFYDIITRIVNKVDKDKIINKIYYQKTHTVNSNPDLLNNLFILDNNFFDEEKEPQKNREVIEDILQYLGMTLIQYANAYYLINYQSLKNNNYQFDYILFDRNDNSTTEGTFKDLRNVNNIGIAEMNGTIELGDTYNKINIIANNNPLQDIIPDLFDDEDLINQNEDPNKFWETQRTFKNKDEKKDDINVTFVSSYFKSKENWYVNLPKDINNPIEVTGENVNTLTGSYFQKMASYESDKVPSSLDFKDYFSMTCGNSYYFEKQKELALIKKTASAFKGGYFIIKLNYKLFTDAFPSDLIPQPETTFKDWTKEERNYGDGLPVTPTKFKAVLKLDKWYWNGDEWDLISNYELKKSRGYFKNLGSFHKGHVEGAKWFRIKDEYGYRKYVTVEEYNNYKGEKASGKCVTNHMVWFKENNIDVFVENNYYDECYLQDGFWLVHENQAGDKCFGQDCAIDNTVSWKMQLADSHDGVAIPLLDNIMFGDIEFELWSCNMLNTYPCYATNQENYICSNVHIDEISLIHTTSTNVKNIYTKEKFDPDILYSNVIDEEYVKEFDDLKLKVNTYSPKAGSYSYVLFSLNNNYDYIDKLTDIYNKEEKKMEEHIINKYVNHYSTPKFVYKNKLNNKNILPISTLHQNQLNKDMIIDAITYDIGNNSANITIKEI